MPSVHSFMKNKNKTSPRLKVGDSESRFSTANLTAELIEELRNVASRQLADERVGHTLQSTALINEAYLRLTKGGEARVWHRRGDFLAAAAEAMRRILIEHARRRKSLKRGGGVGRVALDPDQFGFLDPGEDWFILNDALLLLKAHRADVYELVQLRFFAGLTMEEAAEVLGVSLRTAERDWTYGKAWLLSEMTQRNS